MQNEKKGIALKLSIASMILGIALQDLDTLQTVKTLSAQAELYYKKNNPESLAEAIASLLNNPEKLKSLSRRGYKNSIEKYHCLVYFSL